MEEAKLVKISVDRRDWEWEWGRVGLIRMYLYHFKIVVKTISNILEIQNNKNNISSKTLKIIL